MTFLLACDIKPILSSVHQCKSSHTNNAHLKQLWYLSSGEIFLRIVGVHICFQKAINPVALKLFLLFKNRAGSRIRVVAPILTHSPSVYKTERIKIATLSINRCACNILFPTSPLSLGFSLSLQSLKPTDTVRYTCMLPAHRWSDSSPRIWPADVARPYDWSEQCKHYKTLQYL